MNTPIKFIELTLQNFMSYGNNLTTINLDFKEPVMVIGKNYDAVIDGQVDSNGAGKSAILDAISFVLYNKTISKKTIPGLINNINKKNLEVTLTFQKNGVQYKIVRQVKTKTKSDVQLLVMDKSGKYKDKTPDSIGNTSIEIRKIIGLPFDVFARIIVFSASFQPFLDLPSRHASKANQTGIMEELFGYTELTDKAEKLKEDIKGVKAEFKHLEELQEQIGREIERHKTQILSVSERVESWVRNKIDRIAITKEEIKTLSIIDLDKERQILTTVETSRKTLAELTSEKRVMGAELQTLQAKINSITERRNNIETLKEKVKLIEDKINFGKEEKLLNVIDNLEAQNEEITQTKKDKRKEKVILLERVTTLKKEIEHLEDNECPYCGQDFHGSLEKLNELTVEKSKINEKIDENGMAISELDEKIKKNSDTQDKAKKNSITKGSRIELNKLQTRYENYKAQLESYVEEKIDENALIKIEEKRDDILNVTSQIETENDVIESASKKCTFGSLVELEKVSSKLERTKEQLEALRKEENPHRDTLKELEDTEFDHDKSDRLNELDELLRHQEFLLKLLTKKDSFIRKNLLDRSLPFLNKRLMIYLEKLGLPHRVEFQPDMSANISQFGTILSFDSLSSGQRARVNLGLAFAFRDVLQARHGKISFCILDECLDTGLGNVGVQLAAKMIKEIAIKNNMSMFIISHRDEIANMFENQMIVELKDGFSNITKQS